MIEKLTELIFQPINIYVVEMTSEMEVTCGLIFVDLLMTSRTVRVKSRRLMNRLLLIEIVVLLKTETVKMILLMLPKIFLPFCRFPPVCGLTLRLACPVFPFSFLVKPSVTVLAGTVITMISKYHAFLLFLEID